MFIRELKIPININIIMDDSIISLKDNQDDRA